MSARAMLFAPLLMLTACATTASSPPRLEGTSWQLASASGDGPLTLPEASSVTMQFTADQAGGHGGCNRYSGSYTLQADVLTIGPVVATKRGCMGPGNEIESAWFEVLTGPLKASMQQGELQLVTEAGRTLRLKPVAKQP